MITNNYWQFLSCMQRGVDSDGMYDINNETGWWSYHTTENHGDENRSLTTNITPQFGVIPTYSTEQMNPMSPSDYTVDRQNNNIIYTTISGIVVPEEGVGLKRIYTITGRHAAYTSGSNYYLKRVGLVKQLLDTYDGQGQGLRDRLVLFAEIDLEQPIILKPQDAFSITLCWNQG